MRKPTMTLRDRRAFATGLAIWGGVACSGETDSAANSAGSTSDGAEGTSLGSTSDTTSSQGEATTSTGTTGPATGTDGTTGTGGAASGGAGGTDGMGGTSSMACPAAEPQLGSFCFEGQACTFVYCESPRYLADRVLTCVDEAWALTEEVPCDETPAVACPAYIPVLGQACDSAETTGPCSSLDACGNLNTLWCNNGIWARSQTGTQSAAVASAAASSTTGVPVEPMCPAESPVLGTSCCPNDTPAYCAYPSAANAGSGGSGSGGSSGGSGLGGVGGVTAVTVTLGTTTDITGSAGGSGGAGGGTTAECASCNSYQIWVESELCP